MAEVNISNYELYLTKMSKTFFDKAWFMSNIPEEVETIIDFGCANGTFLKFLENNCPYYQYVGIDNNPKFIKSTQEIGFDCFDSLNKYCNKLDNVSQKTCLVLSSVLHEIYSYDQKDDFLYQIGTLKPKYIAIRDMMFNPVCKERFYLPYIDSRHIMDIFVEKFNDKWTDFGKKWNNIQYPEKLITHFLLKYIYDENWNREVNENYLCLDIDELHKTINDFNYRIEFQTFYKLPYLVNKWKNDFELDKNFVLNEFVRNINTHYKMLLVKND